MFQRIKDSYNNLRRHKIMVALIIILTALCVRLIHQNYDFQQPMVNKRSETYTQVWNSRVVCLDQVSDFQKTRDNLNQDIFNK